MMTSMLMTAVVLVFMVFAGKSHAFIVFVAILGFFLYAMRPVLQAWLLETTPKNMGGTRSASSSAPSPSAPRWRRSSAGMIADRYGLLGDLLVPRGHDRGGEPVHRRHAEGSEGRP